MSGRMTCGTVALKRQSSSASKEGFAGVSVGEEEEEGEGEGEGVAEGRIESKMPIVYVLMSVLVSALK